MSRKQKVVTRRTRETRGAPRGGGRVAEEGVAVALGNVVDVRQGKRLQLQPLALGEHPPENSQINLT